MKLTLPQIVMINHGSRINAQQGEERRNRKSSIQKKKDETDPIVKNGKRMSEMTSEEQASYWMGG